MRKFKGLIVATFTPMMPNHEVDYSRIPALVDYYVENKLNGIFVCGSTGEGPSLTTTERMKALEHFALAASGKLPIFAHVGHTSVHESKHLVSHAASLSIDAISAIAPHYFPLGGAHQLTETMAEIASGAPNLPFYYYHIPALTGNSISLTEFLRRAEKLIPNLAGIKYTSSKFHEYLQCIEFANRKYDILYGYDEMMINALVAGAQGFIGSTFNFAAPVYRALLEAFYQQDLPRARECQMKSIRVVDLITKYGGLAVQKALMKFVGLDCGPVRLPLPSLDSATLTSLETDWRAMELP